MKSKVLTVIVLTLAAFAAAKDKAPEVPVEKQRDYFRELSAYNSMQVEIHKEELMINSLMESIRNACSAAKGWKLDEDQFHKGVFACVEQAPAK